MQVQTSEQTLFNFLILWKSGFPQKKKFYNISYWKEENEVKKEKALSGTEKWQQEIAFGQIEIKSGVKS